MQRRFLEYGLPIARIEAFPALLSYPGPHRPVLELVDASNASEVLFAAGLAEPVVAEDATSETGWATHPYLGYSPAGEETAELVYANYGRPEDFEVRAPGAPFYRRGEHTHQPADANKTNMCQVLAAANVEVAGRIVIVRYGLCFRGLKVMNAQNRGAVGVLIYSDPAEDGYVRGETYPEGPWRPEFGVQRGSSAFMSLCTGDPVRAASGQSVKEVGGVGGSVIRARGRAVRVLAPSQVVERITNHPSGFGFGPPLVQICGYDTEELRPSIPALPISYGDARPLLQSLEGPSAPPDFQGGLDLPSYRLGPSPHSRVHMRTFNRELVSDIWNTIGVLPSTAYGRPADRLVVLSNHRDAWVL